MTNEQAVTAITVLRDVLKAAGLAYEKADEMLIDLLAVPIFDKALNWTKIDMNNLPDAEVLAACFDKKSKSYKSKAIGYVVRSVGFLPSAVCIDDDRTLEGVTHYINIKDFDL